MNRRSHARGSSLPLDDADLRALRAAVLARYDRTARDLPWRGETDPYRVWVSEVMLQQTRVETAQRYYGPWLARFPDLESLATAEPDDVLRAWAGLGYYRRARNLHRAARLVRERSGGEVPSTYRELKELPGLGEYAAGAVASIAFGEAVPAVDGNVRRVLARLLDVAEPRPAWLRRRAALLVDPGRPGDWNQAMMDLGATVCRPAGPRCDACPLARWCRARAAGTQGERPAPPRRRAVRAASYAVAVVVDRRRRALIVRRPARGLLAGMWAFPEVELEDGRDAEDAREALVAAGRAARTAGARAVGPSPLHTLPPVRHRFTHLDATYRPVVLAGSGEGGPGRRWVDLREPDLALPAAQRRIAGAVVRALGEWAG